jgi:hypothetical protein
LIGIRLDNASVASLAFAHPHEVTMSIQRVAVLTVLLAALAAILGSALPALATGGTATPVPPDRATTLAEAPMGARRSSTSVLDGRTVLNAASQPGAETSIESGVSAQAAVGVAPLYEGNAISATRPVCWQNSARSTWGTWPYDQRITDATYWCAIYGSHITYRTSSTSVGGTLCGVGWRSNQLIVGGVGHTFTSFTTRASAGSSCPTTIPWITIHTTHHDDVKRNDRGVTSFVGAR